MAAGGIRLFDVPPGAKSVLCRDERCKRPIVFVVNEKTGKRVPVSLTHPDAKIVNGEVVAAPSHYTDCPGANDFTKRRK